jgi:hypothetical protein
MKYLKMLGLAAVAAMGLMAFLGAGTASATLLCETNVTTGCTSAWDVASGSTLLFTAEGSTTLTDAFGNLVDTCTGSTVEGKSSTGGGSTTETVSGGITKLEFTGCTKTTTVVETHPGTSEPFGKLEVHSVAGTKNGTVTSTGSTVIIHNTIFGTCQFQTNSTDLGTLTGKDNTASGKPTLDIGADTTGRIPSENCGFNGIWEGSYEYTGTTPFNVTAS